MRTRLVLLLTLFAGLLAPIATAGAADTHAPKGARLDWLPGDEWVMSAWMPFDEARLDAVLRTDHDHLVTWLDDHRTLLQLARAHRVKGTTGAMSRSEADHLLAEQKAQLTVYLGRAFRTPEQQVAFLCRPH